MSHFPKLTVLASLVLLAYPLSANAEQSFLDAPPTVSEEPLELELPEEDLSLSPEVCCCEGCCRNSLCTRKYLTGDWCGRRTCLAQKGIVTNFQLTQFYQGVASGGVEQRFPYGGKLDYFFIFMGDQLGLCSGLNVIMHAETRFGQDANLSGVGMSPCNTNMTYPTRGNDTAITGLLFDQRITDSWHLNYGKFNTLDLFNMIYPQTGRGVNGFMNTSMLIPLTVGRTLEPAILGGGLMKKRGQQVQGGLFVFDTTDAMTTVGFDSLFSNGATVAGIWRFFTEACGLPGSHLIGGFYSSGNYTTLDPLDWSFIPGEGLTAENKAGSWSLLYVAEQTLWADCCNPQRNLGLLSMWGISDGNPNPYHWIGNVAIQGNGLIACREADTMGAGYFYCGMSGYFKQILSQRLDLQDVQGVELYYNAAINKWCHLSADLQFVQPANTAQDTAVIFGLRLKIDI